MIKALEPGLVNSAGIMVPCPPQWTYNLGGQAEWEGRRCNPGGSHAVPPRLFRACLEISAPVCRPPAIDGEFKTIDFLTLVDLQAPPDHVRTPFF
jgi:hypothetical protein